MVRVRVQMIKAVLVVALLMESAWCGGAVMVGRQHTHLGAPALPTGERGAAAAAVNPHNTLEDLQAVVAAADTKLKMMEAIRNVEDEMDAELTARRCGPGRTGVDCLLGSEAKSRNDDEMQRAGMILLLLAAIAAAAVWYHTHHTYPLPKKGPLTGSIVEIRYINLEEKKERRSRMEVQLSRLHLPYQRSPAYKIATIDEVTSTAAIAPFIEKTPSFEYDKDCRSNPKQPLQTRAAFVLSVYLSHLATYQSLANKHRGVKHRKTTATNDTHENDAVLILEDDVIVDTNLQERYRALTDHLPNDWEMVRLGMFGESRQEDRVDDAVWRATRPFWDNNVGKLYYGGAHAVAIRVNKLDSVISKLKRNHLNDIDAMMTNIKELQSYVVHPWFPLVEIDKTVGGSENPVGTEYFDKKLKEWGMATA